MKQVTFHQARVEVTFVSIEGRRSVATHVSQIPVYLNTAEEWQAVHQRIEAAMQEMAARLDEGND